MAGGILALVPAGRDRRQHCCSQAGFPPCALTTPPCPLRLPPPSPGASIPHPPCPPSLTSSTSIPVPHSPQHAMGEESSSRMEACGLLSPGGRPCPHALGMCRSGGTGELCPPWGWSTGCWVAGTTSGVLGSPELCWGLRGWSPSFAAATVSKSPLGSVPQFPLSQRTSALNKGDFCSCQFSRHAER